jgi:NAD(P)-dependent dehydrogenase (short-subunit alcohol dehydrogenase family)
MSTVPDGYTGGWTRVPHSTAKGALRTLTKSLAASLGEYGITVNDVNTGFMDTLRDYETHPGLTPEFSAQRAKERNPIKRNLPLVARLEYIGGQLTFYGAEVTFRRPPKCPALSC